MISETRRCWRSKTPPIIAPCSLSVPDCTTNRSSSSLTSSALSSSSISLQVLNTHFDNCANLRPTGPTTLVKSPTGGHSNRAVISALLTPIVFGINSPKNRVAAVNPDVASEMKRREPLDLLATTSVNMAVDRMLQIVVAINTVDNTRVMSRSSIVKMPLPRSSSANSLTFHGYRVVIDTSAACNNAEDRKSAPKVMAFRTSPETVETARAAAGSTGPARPMARGFVCAIRFGGGASKAVAAAAQQSASFSARAMLV
mmetsp:Transcript_2413/g.6864  ORF Transcript_2413/g.6864 Transcript_2413/m.6864 type:complete len:257 (+) Transcript_2413:786-1556(+)